MMIRSLPVLFLALYFTGCKKQDVAFSTTPEITFESISPASAKQFQDHISIVISYKDGDGNLGEANPDSKSLYVTDSRTGVLFSLRIPDLSTPKGTPPIQGKIDIALPPPVLNNTNSVSETGNYEIYLVDRAGNMSNKVKTSNITIVP